MNLTAKTGTFLVEYKILDDHVISIDPSYMLRQISDRDVSYKISKYNGMYLKDALKTIRDYNRECHPDGCTSCDAKNELACLLGNFIKEYGIDKILNVVNQMASKERV